MFELVETLTFSAWLQALRDRSAKVRILSRLDRLAMGHPGDAKSVRDGVMELRIDHGPGYRIYYTRQGETIVLLLCGGDKSTQDRDIDRAKSLARKMKEQYRGP